MFKPWERKAIVTWWVFTRMNVGMIHRFFQGSDLVIAS